MLLTLAAMPKDASVYQRTGRKTWYVSYWCPDRMRRVHEATAWAVDAPASYKNALRFAAEKSKSAQSFRGTAKAETWAAWVTDFLNDQYRNQQKTLKRYLGAWDWLYSFLSENKVMHPNAFSYQLALDFVKWRSEQKRNCGKKITRNTALCDIRVMAVIMREAVRRGFAAHNPCASMRMRRDPSKEKPEMTDAEIELIYAKIAVMEKDTPLQDRWMSTSLTIALHHGCRLRETQIPYTSIDFRAKTLRFIAKGRNGEPHVFTVSIHPGLIGLLESIKATGAAYTCVLPQMPSKAWWSLFQSDPRLKHLCFHCTRVTVVTRLARAGVSLSQAMRYVGHSSQTVHRIYQRLRADDLGVCHSALAGIAPGA